MTATSPTSSSAVMWLLGHYSTMVDQVGGHALRQMEGVRELAALADSYVLNDVTYVGGRSRRMGLVEEFLQDEDETGAIVLISQEEMRPFRTALGILDADDKLPELDRANYEEYQSMLRRANDPLADVDIDDAHAFRSNFTIEHETRIAQANTAEALAYLYFADTKQADYFPERIFGVEALKQYQLNLTRRWHNADFAAAIKARIGTADHLPPETHPAPFYLLEALRSAATPKGFIACLRELRDSDAAANYRRLAGLVTMRSTSLKERATAVAEIKRILAATTAEPRITKSWRTAVGLSSVAVGLLYPPAAAAAGALPVLVEVADAVDEWLRRRTDIFLSHGAGNYHELYVELDRVFGKLNFEPEQLGQFMISLDFVARSSQR